MNQLEVKGSSEANTFSYDIVWEDRFDTLADALLARKLVRGKICIITDSTVAGLYLDPVKESLAKLGVPVSVFVFQAGEASKNLDTVKLAYEHLIQEHFERKDLLVALGGGVVGDLCGFTAATYLRGIDFIQIPTTLLAQVDSSIGGKTGVDFDAYKNMVGAFLQPRFVFMNIQTLQTLPDSQFASGMGEVLKTGLLQDAKFYGWTIGHMDEIDERITPVLVKMVKKCCQIKAAIVAEDPKEQGVRALLNLGHTIGHAIEKLKNFELLHGQCVALGTIAAAYISHERGMISDEELYEIRDMNVGFQLPITFDDLDPAAILKATKSDKKMEEGKVKFILLDGIGHAVIDHTVTDEELLAGINFIHGDAFDED